MKDNKSFRIKKYPICDCSRTNQRPYTGQIKEIAHYMRTYLSVTNIKVVLSEKLIFDFIILLQII